MTYQLTLNGCTPVPLAGYLKALGVLRVVAEQIDTRKTDSCSRGWWERDAFLLDSTLSADQLIDFFLTDYTPTPLVAPWNGGSGFFPKDNQTAINAIAQSSVERFAPYRKLIEASRLVLTTHGLTEKPSPDEKPRLLQQCRNLFPDAALDWLDAAFVLTQSGPKYPPLLGTGGNDGRLEFTNNFMQRLVETIDPKTGKATQNSAELLHDSIFNDCGTTRDKAAIGQFDPGSAGGANSSGGYDAAPTMNVWDFILMLEGAIAFAGSAVRKLESATSGSLAYPFCVRAAGVGYGSSDVSDEPLSRSEMWMPLWQQPASFRTISHLLSEGRANTGRRQARNGVDFARAVASVGVDRGIHSFQRFGFQQRNGLSYFAVPLGRFDVRQPSNVMSLVNSLDGWLDRFRRQATGQHAPASAARALRKVESAVFDVCQHPSTEATRKVLVALGTAEAAIATSPSLREADYTVRPVPLLPPEWIAAAYGDCKKAPQLDDSKIARSFRLAASLASLGFSSGSLFNNQLMSDPVGPFRRHVEPIQPDALRNPKNAHAMWAEQANDPSLVWAGGSLAQNLNRVLNRRMIDAIRLGGKNLHAPFHGKCPALLPDIFRFIEGDVDDSLIESFAKGLMLVDWAKVNKTHIPWRPDQSYPNANDPFPSAAYCLLKLCLLPHPIPLGDGEVEIKLTPQIARRASMGHLTEATQLAARRLKASGLKPAIEQVHNHDIDVATRTAAALVFPVSSKTSTIRFVRDRVMFREAASKDFDNAATK